MSSIQDQDELEENKNRIVETLNNYNIGISNIKATIGPTVTLYEIVPNAGVRISKIKNLEDFIEEMANLTESYIRGIIREILSETLILEISAEEVETTLAVASRHVSVDAPFVEGEDNSLLDVLENDKTPGTDEDLDYTQSLSKEINRSLNSLTERQCDVIKLYYGIGLKHPMSLEDIGDKFGLTRERVRQIKDKAINKLRTTNRSKLLKNYLGAK
jgi:RNA polymerase primary sigma factor